MTDGLTYGSIGKQLYYFEGIGGKQGIEQLLEMDSQIVFKKNLSDDVNFGFVTNPYWLRFKLKNTTDKWQHLVLKTQSPYLNNAQFFEQKKDSLLVSAPTGDHLPAHTRQLFNRGLCFKIMLAPKEESTGYLLLDQSNEGLRTFVMLGDEYSFWKHETLETLVNGSVFGVSVIMILMSLIFFCVFKQRMFFLYCLYFTFLSATHIASTGYGFIFLHPFSINFQQVGYFQFIGAAGIVATLFSMDNILGIVKMKGWKWINYSYLLMAVLLIIYAFIYDGNRKAEHESSNIPIYTSYIISIANYLVLAFFVLKACIITKRNELFLLLLLLLFGVASWVILFLTELGRIPYTYFASEFTFFWVLFETLLASAAMFFRVRMIYKEKLSLESSLYSEKRRAVKEFTKGQHLERQRLSQDLHDGISLKLASVKAQLSNFQVNLKEQDLKNKVAPILSLVGTTAEDVRNFSHALGSVTLKNFGIAPAIEDLIATLQTTYPNVQLAYDADEFRPAWLDEEAALYLLQILQELLNNVYKHSKANKVMVQLFNDEHTLTATVIDNGLGYEPSNLNNKGIGLKSINSRVLLLEGKFEILTKNGGGMKHIVTLPLNIRKGKNDDDKVVAH
ncbi:MAG: hypothetical protein IT258_01030 [Saprospiraceae bacterium]|nr:hypothetical protein [Saprospiraceae bacterium]